MQQILWTEVLQNNLIEVCPQALTSYIPGEQWWGMVMIISKEQLRVSGEEQVKQGANIVERCSQAATALELIYPGCVVIRDGHHKEVVRCYLDRVDVPRMPTQYMDAPSI